MQTQIRFSLLLAALLQICLGNLFAQVIYVKHDAIGAQDGTSWHDAYTDLEDALFYASDDVIIWVAQGVYHPGGSSPDPNSVFVIHDNILLYGGFAGVETTLEDRDPDSFVTILSGDIQEDDVVDNFIINKFDNTRHVVYVDSLLSEVVIDGFTIKGGHTIDDFNATIYDRSGGGIHCLSPVTIRQCNFTGNFGRAGGGVYLSGNASTSLISNCTFSHNRSSSRGAGLFALSVTDLQVVDSDFNNNNTQRGTLCFIACSRTDVSKCYFNNNINTSATASGGIGSFDNVDLSIRNCIFTGNQSAGGTAIFFSGTAIPSGQMSNLLVDSCRFENNSASATGAGIQFKSNPDITISNSEFVNNTASGGGAIAINQGLASWTDSNNVIMNNCTFLNNVATSLGGGAIHLDSTSIQIVSSVFDNNRGHGGGHIFGLCPDQSVAIRHCTFQQGLSEINGGAVVANGNHGSFLFHNCIFRQNHATDYGGAVNNLSHSKFTNCLFEENTSGIAGGALSQYGDSTLMEITLSHFERNSSTNGGVINSNYGDNHTIVDRSTFFENQVTQHCGTIRVAAAPGAGKGSIAITNSIFAFNTAQYFSGVLDVWAADTYVANSVFYENRSSDSVAAAVFFLQATDHDTMTATFINNTIVNNHGITGDGLSLATSDTASVLTAYVQNNIFRNKTSSNFRTTHGTPLLLSHGGNMSNDLSMIPYLVHSQDLNQTEPIFSDPLYFDFSLTKDSPGIDAGVVQGAPEFDILGNPRVNAPDMGAFENQNPVSTSETRHLSPFSLVISPNPVKRDQKVWITLDNARRGKVNTKITDLNGRTLLSLEHLKETDLLRFEMTLPALHSGCYFVVASNGNERYATPMFIR